MSFELFAMSSSSPFSFEDLDAVPTEMSRTTVPPLSSSLSGELVRDTFVDDVPSSSFTGGIRVWKWILVHCILTLDR